MAKKNKEGGLRTRAWALAFIDLLSLALVYFLILYINPSFRGRLPIKLILLQFAMGVVLVYSWRLIFGVYQQIWRFGNIPSFIRLLEADACAVVLYCVINRIIPVKQRIPIIQAMSIISWNLLFCLAMRMVYSFLYQYHNYTTPLGRMVRPFVNILTGLNIAPSENGAATRVRKIKVAIVGAGRVGYMLADELLTNLNAPYEPVVFIDIDREKVGGRIFHIPVASSQDAQEVFSRYGVQEIILAMPDVSAKRKKELYEAYKETGCKILIYDFPRPEDSHSGDKPTLRDFGVEDLLFRPQRDFLDENTKAFFCGKTVMITGGGGSIGSELCRQIARMKPQKLIIVDVYENSTYDILQELKIAYGDELDLALEIFSVTDERQLDRCFEQYRPQIVLHAAAHKHVPLMENNVCEAVANNVFGTLAVVNAAEKYGVEKFIMISTDKAVNPTNVMGATKRMCEMIVLSRAGSGNAGTSFSCTRFGNVLGSNGSVIPLFKRQIAAGGPVTVTDKRIIRYFMTIPEASQLVLTSGAMARNGELFVLDMGSPVKIYDLAVNMIRLSGLKPEKDIKIIEVGLRPGEKLYEELLIKPEDLEKTENQMIFVEHQTPISREEAEEKLRVLRAALATNDNEAVRAALHRVVPDFKTPEEINGAAEDVIGSE